MKVVVLGGYGVFGSRLAELVIRDGHDIVIAGRDLRKAKEIAARLGGRALAVDLRVDPEKIFAEMPDVVVDAAGPFQAYGDGPYRIPGLCLEHNADYLDLSDDAAFTEGISSLDGPARDKGRRLLSGASSVPGLSSAVVAELAAGCDEILLIDTAILPGNRAPRGGSVLASIIGQLGRTERTERVWRGGEWRSLPAWSHAKRFRLAPGLTRTGYFIAVPDTRLFPAFFRARSVMFRAGMELGVLNVAMTVLARVRRLWPFDVTPGRVRIIQWLADRLLSFGTDRGGMYVAVVGRWGGDVRRREWRMIAEAGDGPYVPAVTIPALLRRWDRVPVGARPCLAELTLGEIREAMADLSVKSEISEEPYPTLFQKALGDRWRALPAQIQALHSVQDIESFSGKAEITRGGSAVARLAAWFFGFPKAGNDVPVTVTKARTTGGETWTRDFAGRVFRSHLTPAEMPNSVREGFGPFRFELDLPVENGSMYLPVRRGWFLGLPIPSFFLPRSDSREYVEDGVFHFDVALSAPLGGGLIVRYRGRLTPDARPAT